MKKLFTPLVFLFFSVYAIGQETKGYSDNNGQKTCYRTFGSSEKSMLIINGGPGMNSNGFEWLARELASRYQLKTIIYDQRGTGNSSMASTNEDNITLDLMISDIEGLRKHLDIEEWIVFGQSFGGMLASYYATLHPQRIEKLILSSSGGIDLNGLSELNILGRLTREEREKYNYWNSKVQENNSYENLYNRGLYLASAYLEDKSHIPTIAERLTQGNMLLNRLVFSNLYDMGFNCAHKLKAFTKPVLIIQGDQDIVSKGAAERAHDIFPNSTLHFVPNSSHYGWLDNPTDYFEQLKLFCLGY